MEAMEAIYENIARMERKHTRDYYDEQEMFKNEKDTARRESLMTLLVSEQARMEALQFAEGVVMGEMKKRNFWNGSRAEKMNMKKWRSEQYKKHIEE